MQLLLLISGLVTALLLLGYLWRLRARRRGVDDPVTLSIEDAPSMTEGAETGDVPALQLDENVQFTVHRPREVTPGRWYPLLAFVHLASPRSDEPGASDPGMEVQRQAERLLDLPGNFSPVTTDGLHAIPRSGELTLVPCMTGVEFNPPQFSFRWEQSVHRAEFQLRASPQIAGKTARGHLTIFLGSIIVGDVPLAIPLAAAGAITGQPSVREHARPYRNVFASYSHLDTAIVEEVERVAESFGDKYLRDLHDLRAGEVWSDALTDLIRRADVFQLFWSWNSIASPFVRREWEFALTLGRPHFVRPVYWQQPLPATATLPSAALGQLHFHRLASPLKTVATGSRPLSTLPPNTRSISLGHSVLERIVADLSAGSTPLAQLGDTTSPPEVLELSTADGMLRYSQLVAPVIDTALKNNRRAETALVMCLVLLLSLTGCLSWFANTRGVGWATPLVLMPGLAAITAWSIRRLVRIRQDDLTLQLLPTVLRVMSPDDAREVVRRLGEVRK